MNYEALASIDLDALRHNLAQVRSHAPTSRVVAMLKADAYGHGAVVCAQALEDADAFAVARFSEAQILRQTGIDKRIVLLPGVFSSDALTLAAQLRLDIVIHQASQLELLEQARGVRLNVWLKVNTGMYRMGFNADAVGDLCRRIQACPALSEPLKLMTHLSDADDRNSLKTACQIQTLLDCAGSDVEISIANSAGILGWPNAHQHWVRPGIMLYGSSPFANECGVEQNLKPVMQLTTQLLDVKSIPKGACVGYGSLWTAPQDLPIGAAAIGYADGYPRNLPSGTPVLINGRRAEIAGRISMDTICIDLRSCPEAKIGDEVLLWGHDLPVETIAQRVGSISYELLSRVGPRVRRVIMPALS